MRSLPRLKNNSFFFLIARYIVIYLSLATPPEVLHVYRVDDDDVLVSVVEVVEEAFVEKYLPPNLRN